MSKLSTAICALRAGLVETINASGLPPCIVALVLEQVSGQVRILEAKENEEAEDERAEQTGDATE